MRLSLEYTSADSWRSAPHKQRMVVTIGDARLGFKPVFDAEDSALDHRRRDKICNDFAAYGNRGDCYRTAWLPTQPQDTIVSQVNLLKGIFIVGVTGCGRSERSSSVRARVTRQVHTVQSETGS
ncbi:hypothetical protein ElyMa_005750900 [Elysia marginata]|uniref:Uncharacterized protein n=1 Tax=Elysia marginata TaxID=1093978 RepID=A0AAV4FNG2_9GAST|nr:hypothetical protein ElyMa_005750900 [Elysia marginata]